MPPLLKAVTIGAICSAVLFGSAAVAQDTSDTGGAPAAPADRDSARDSPADHSSSEGKSDGQEQSGDFSSQTGRPDDDSFIQDAGPNPDRGTTGPASTPDSYGDEDGADHPRDISAEPK